MTIYFRQGSVGTHIRRGGEYIPHTVGNLLSCQYAKNCKNQLNWTKLLQKQKGAIFLRFELNCCEYLCLCNNAEHCVHGALNQRCVDCLMTASHVVAM